MRETQDCRASSWGLCVAWGSRAWGHTAHGAHSHVSLCRREKLVGGSGCLACAMAWAARRMLI